MIFSAIFFKLVGLIGFVTEAWLGLGEATARASRASFTPLASMGMTFLLLAGLFKLFEIWVARD